MNRRKKNTHRLTLRIDSEVYSELSALSYKRDIAINAVVASCIKYALVASSDKSIDLHEIMRIASKFVGKKGVELHDDLSIKERVGE